jgi:hypothetical protein
MSERIVRQNLALLASKALVLPTLAVRRVAVILVVDTLAVAVGVVVFLGPGGVRYTCLISLTLLVGKT